MSHLIFLVFSVILLKETCFSFLSFLCRNCLQSVGFLLTAFSDILNMTLEDCSISSSDQVCIYYALNMLLSLILSKLVNFMTR